jgi:hypothetical protein
LRWHAILIVIGEAVAQPQMNDYSANSMFAGCKAFAENKDLPYPIIAEASYCSGMLNALALVGQILATPELRFCLPPRGSLLANKWQEWS